MSKVSLIIPIYNVGKYLSQCLDSVLAQTYTDFEAILVDDGSTDESGRICEEYTARDPRFVLIHKENGGLSSARNAGLKIAKSEYIVFLDSDDTVKPIYLEKLMAPESQYDLVVCGVEKVREDGTVFKNIVFSEKQYSHITSQEVCEMISESSIDYCVGKRFKTKIIKEQKLSFFDRKGFIEDTLFVTQYLNFTKKVFILSHALYQYYQHAGTLSEFDSRLVGRLQEANQMIEKELKKHFAEVIDSSAWKKRIFSVYHYAISCIISGGGVLVCRSVQNAEGYF